MPHQNILPRPFRISAGRHVTEIRGLFVLTCQTSVMTDDSSDDLGLPGGADAYGIKTPRDSDVESDLGAPSLPEVRPGTGAVVPRPHSDLLHREIVAFQAAPSQSTELVAATPPTAAIVEWDSQMHSSLS